MVGGLVKLYRGAHGILLLVDGCDELVQHCERLLTVLLIYCVDVAAEPGRHDHWQTTHPTLHCVEDTLPSQIYYHIKC